MIDRLAILISLLLACVAHASTVQDFVRVKGQGQSVLQGIGLVTGLPGTGDSGKDLAMARALAEALQNSGAGVGSLRELEKTGAVALVFVTCTIPAIGGRVDDRFDCSITTAGTAKSLRGGRLFLTALRGPYRGGPVYAVAEGPIDLEDGITPTTGRVRAGAQLIRDILMPEIGDEFDLILDTHFAGWPMASAIADAVNSEHVFGPRIARAMDDRTIRVTIPAEERANRGAFLAAVFSAPVNTGALPAQVICNSRTGAIIVTGNVEIAPVVITHKDLVITTTIPAPTPTLEEPLIRRDGWMAMESPPATGVAAARLADLLAAFKQLDVPVADQIQILQMLQKTGKLRARLVID